MHEVICKKTKVLIGSYETKQEAEKKLKELNEANNLERGKTFWKVKSPK